MINENETKTNSVENTERSSDNNTKYEIHDYDKS